MGKLPATNAVRLQCPDFFLYVLDVGSVATARGL